MTTIIGSGTTVQTANKMRSTYVYGNFANFDKSDGSIPAYAAFQRNVLVAGNLLLGTETLDGNGNAIDSSSNIQFTLNKTLYNIPLKTLSYISNLTSDCQQQISNLTTSSGGNISNVGYLTQTLSDITSTQFGTNAYNKLLLSTTSLYNSAFGGNTLYNNTTGNFNTAVGHSSGFANTTGSCITAVGQQALAKNTSGNYNTAIGFLSSVDNTTGTANTSMGSYSLLHNTIGSYNTAIGFFSATENTTGSSNSSFGFDTLHSNTTGNNNSAFGYHALRNNTTGYNNTSVGSASGQSMLATVGSTCIGTNADTAFNYSTAIGSNSVCTADHQIMLGTENETVFICGKTIQNSPLVLNQTLNVSGLTTLTDTHINTNLTIDGELVFNGTINSLSTFQFAKLTNVRSDIQQQFDNNTPVGSVLTYAGTASSLTGYLPCNGDSYRASSFPSLYNAIGYTYGGETALGLFKVPNFNAVFLRGSGSQTVNGRTYSAPNIGSISSDSIGQTTSSNQFVNNLSILSCDIL
jgi:hypothetical protein